MDLVDEDAFKVGAGRGTFLKLSPIRSGRCPPTRPSARSAPPFATGCAISRPSDQDLQTAVIHRIAGLPETCARAFNPNSLLASTQSSETIASNRAKIAEHFSLDAYGRQLATLYHRIANAPVEPPQPLPPASVLNRFLAPERFCLLRT